MSWRRPIPNFAKGFFYSHGCTGCTGLFNTNRLAPRAGAERVVSRESACHATACHLGYPVHPCFFLLCLLQGKKCRLAALPIFWGSTWEPRPARCARLTLSAGTWGREAPAIPPSPLGPAGPNRIPNTGCPRPSRLPAGFSWKALSHPIRSEVFAFPAPPTFRCCWMPAAIP